MRRLPGPAELFLKFGLVAVEKVALPFLAPFLEAPGMSISVKKVSPRLALPPPIADSAIYAIYLRVGGLPVPEGGFFMRDFDWIGVEGFLAVFSSTASSSSCVILV